MCNQGLLLIFLFHFSYYLLLLLLFLFFFSFFKIIYCIYYIIICIQTEHNLSLTQTTPDWKSIWLLPGCCWGFFFPLSCFSFFFFFWFCLFYFAFFYFILFLHTQIYNFFLLFFSWKNPKILYRGKCWFTLVVVVGFSPPILSNINVFHIANLLLIPPFSNIKTRERFWTENISIYFLGMFTKIPQLINK